MLPGSQAAETIEYDRAYTVDFIADLTVPFPSWQIQYVLHCPSSIQVPLESGQSQYA